jgi:uncharacterized membrane protein (GlpM family)
MYKNIFIFVLGGSITLAITYFQEAGFPLLSRLAALFPVFTWISYIFIGQGQGGASEVSRHSLYVVLGTIFTWVPYMLVIHFLTPRLGATKTILIAIGVFLVLALIFIKVYPKFLPF